MPITAKRGGKKSPKYFQFEITFDPSDKHKGEHEFEYGFSNNPPYIFNGTQKGFVAEKKRLKKNFGLKIAKVEKFER